MDQGGDLSARRRRRTTGSTLAKVQAGCKRGDVDLGIDSIPMGICPSGKVIQFRLKVVRFVVSRIAPLRGSVGVGGIV